jgi:hypothetical protein
MAKSDIDKHDAAAAIKTGYFIVISVLGHLVIGHQ